MWYLAEILFVEPNPEGRACQCEACNVLFEASTAMEAHAKANDWGKAYAGESPAAMKLLGGSHLTHVGEKIGDGTEICGRLFQSPDVWDRVNELIPAVDLLAAVRWEQSQDQPLRDLLDAEKQ